MGSFSLIEFHQEKHDEENEEEDHLSRRGGLEWNSRNAIKLIHIEPEAYSENSNPLE